MCPTCQAPEEADWASAAQVMTKVRIRCLMGHSRWVELAVQTEREGLGGATPPQKHPPRECVSCHRMIEAPTANNQRRHARCAVEYTNAQRREAERAARGLRRKPPPLKRRDPGLRLAN